MSAIEVVKRYSDAWNRRDADAIVALFVEGVFTAYPDASFEIVSIGDTGGGLVAWQWLARGTNSGPLADGSPPTGRSVTLPARASLKWRVTRFAPSRPIMTDRRLMSN